MKKKLVIIIPVVIAILAFILVYRYYNHQDKKTSLTVAEKKWIQENNRSSIDFEVINDYPIYGVSGDGVFYNFIKDMSKDIGLEFNIIPYLKNSKTSTNSLRFRILGNDEKQSEDDLLLFEDYYIAIGKTYQRINHIKDMKNITYGVFDTDAETISYYLKSGTNLSYKQYKTIDELYTALEQNQVNMIIVPNIMYLNKTIDNSKYSINYYFTEMNKRIVLSLGKNEDLNKIVRKYYQKWQAVNFIKEYDKEYFDYYITMNKLTSKQRNDLVSKVYTYGYVENIPYEKKVNGRVAGIAGEYLDRVSRLTNIDFKYKKYKNIDELEKAIKNKEIDMYFDYYGLEGDGYKATLSTFIEDYVILGRQEDNFIINSFESIRNKDVAMIDNDSLYNYVNNNGKAYISKYKNVNELVKKAKNSLLIVDLNVYTRYQNSKFKNYKLLYMDTMMSDYKFMIRESNSDFYKLVNYMINTNSYYVYRNAGIENLDESFLEHSNLEQIYTIVLIVIFVPIILISIIVSIMKKKKKQKVIKITDRHKYTDMLTSLKNRNYLNVKMPEWEESKVYPQAIVVIDLNNVKYINDNYGHEEGDKLIIEAAGILVNTQLENSEIIRTDGNEFLIYLVGYTEKQVTTYTKKLSKEMKKLPHEFGAGVGCSIINDEIKTLDDAINEATMEMIADKEEYK